MGSELNYNNDKTSKIDTRTRNDSPVVENLIDVNSPEETITNVPALTPITTSPIANSSVMSTINVLEEQLLPLKIEEPPSENNEEECREKESIAITTNEATNVAKSVENEEQIIRRQEINCDKCEAIQLELNRMKDERLSLENRMSALEKSLVFSKNELDREVQRRVDLEQRFTEEAKRTTDQIEELIVKSDRDDTKLNELRRKFEMYSRETSSMIENFTTNREVLASQLLELRNENDYLLGQYLSKAHELQSAEIDLPQNIEDLQFHCLTLNEKLILATTAKERLEETLAKSFSSSTSTSKSTPTNTTTPA